MQHNSAEYKAYVSQGFEGDINTMSLQWAHQYGATSDTVNEAVIEALQISGGATSDQYNTAWRETLLGLGYEGSVSDMQREFWEDGGSLTPIAIEPPIIGGRILLDYDLSVGVYISYNMNEHLLSNGGTTNLTWMVSEGELPTGISLNPNNGIVSGTPTEATVATFIEYRVSNIAGESNPINHTVSVVEEVSPPILGGIPDMEIGQGESFSYNLSQHLISDGGDSVLTWRITTGFPPDGLSLDPSTGILSGTPTSIHTQIVGYTVANSAGDSNESDHEIAVVAVISAPILGEIPDDEATVGTPYSLDLNDFVTDDGGDPSFTWSIPSGGLPPGVFIDTATGIVAGTPSFVGVFNPGYAVSNSAGRSNISVQTITIEAAIEAPSIDTIPDVDMVVGTEYSFDLTNYLISDGGDSEIVWSVNSGTLPDGITLDPSGVIGGTPTVAVVVTIGYVATNSVGASNESTHTATVTDVITAPVLEDTLIDYTISLNTEVTYDLSGHLLSDGGDSDLIWSVSSGDLPLGIGIGISTGIISGIAVVLTPAGDIGYSVTNSAGMSNEIVHNVEVIADVTSPILDTIPNRVINLNVSFSLDLNDYLVSDGGDSDITWSVATGALPTGLNLGATTGLVTGTPTVEEVSTIGYIATNSVGDSNTSSHTITVTDEQELPISSVGEISIAGLNGILEAYLNNDETVTGFSMILYTNTENIDNTTTPDEFIRPVGGDYQDVVLDRNNFEVVDGIVTYPRVTFNNIGTDYSLPVTGWALITEEAIPVQVGLCNSGELVDVGAGGSPYQVEMQLEFITGDSNGVTNTNALNLIALNYFIGQQTELVGALVLNLVDITGTPLLGDGGYAEITLSDAWTIANGTATYPLQSWTAVGTAFSDDVAGAIIETGTGVLMHTDMNSSPVAILEDDTYNYDLSIG